MICEIKAASEKSREYQPCTEEATRISRFGWLACETHASVADLRLDEIELFELQERINKRRVSFPVMEIKQGE